MLDDGMSLWIETFTGRKVNPLKMTADDVSIEDIAHALALKCRFTGHCPHFYSIAQHSILVSQFCDGSKQDKFWALLHDAPEAYTADIARPVKIGLRSIVGDALDKIDRLIMDAICEKFKLPLDEPPCVKVADNLVLVTEGRCFFGKSKTYQDWHHRPENCFKIIEPPIIPKMSWEESEQAFLESFRFFG